MTLSRFQLWYGRASAPGEPRELRAGPLTLLLDGADLRRVRLGDVEAVQRIYVAVRDAEWNTIPATYSDVVVENGGDHFTVSFQARHAYQDLDFTWRGTITGDAAGTIEYSMDGVAGFDFPYNKIGFNVHHPLRESVGHHYYARTPQGEIDGVLPELIEPQRAVDGMLTAMFAPYDSLTIDLAPGVQARFDFDGDLFEMQDHRNWTDGNFKSYGTPLSIPVPLSARAGQRLRQKVTVMVSGAPAQRPAGDGTPRLELGQAAGRALPALGVGMASHGHDLSAREAALLRALRLDHLRADLHLAQPSFGQELNRAARACATLGARLELAIFANEETDDGLQECAALLRESGVPVTRVHVFEETTGGRSSVAGSTPGRLVRRVRERLAGALPGVPFIGGTNGFFAELNRDRPEVAVTDGIVYAITPQAHACDDTSLVENLAAQAATVTTARSFCSDKPILISPVTFIGRFGPWAAGPPRPGDIPPQVDRRQMSLFGAGWTACSVKYLAGSGAAALTYFETTGWLGLMETATGSPRPDSFPSSPGMVFPLYHVFADLAEWKGADLVPLSSSDPLAVEGLAVRAGDRTHVLAANLTHQPRTVALGPLAAKRVQVRSLDEESALVAMAEPDRFRSSGSSVEVRDGLLSLTLAPCAVVRVDELDG